MKNKKILLITIAIIACIIVAIGIVLIKSTSKKEELKSKYPNLRWIVVSEKKESEIFENMETQMAKARVWENLSITEQFSSVEYANNRYYANDIEITVNSIEKQLETKILSGHDDVQPNIEHTKKATIYKIKGINTKFAIAIKFEEKASYYICVNRNYSTNTLGELMEDLNLRENLQFSTINYSEVINNNNVNFEFKGIPEDVIWKMLFSDTKAIGKFGGTKDRLNIKATYKLFENEYAECTITEDGYLSIYINCFNRLYVYIGEERTKAFFNYVFDNYKAEATVYIREPKDDEQDKIMVMENTL